MPDRSDATCSSRGVLGRYRSAVLSHVSAVVAHDLPTYRFDLGTVHLTRTAAGRIGRIGRHPTVRVHPALPWEAVADVAGLPVCTAAIAVLQLADTRSHQ